ncbi:hypothetical protein [Virgibacillus sp. L01]|uniref:hypothetical protein n=1 Tax=Virgibacillus sp. L01 TaxID=3457429 RepID=UPI003FD2FAB5
MSNQDSLVLELFNRVKMLEEKVALLEVEKGNQSSENEVIDSDHEQEKKITRSVARQYVIDEIRELNSTFNVIKGNRSTAADLIIKGKSTINSKFYYSRSYIEDYPSSWYTVKKNDVTDKAIDLYIFTLAYENEFHTLLITPSELKMLVKDKQPDNSNKYHFYFHKRGERLLEVRDDEINVTKYYERWNILNEL